MAAKLIWSPKARLDLKKIYVDIAREQPEAAERYFHSFRHKASLLIEQPRLGPRHLEISASARILVEAPYVILYETIPDTDKGPVQTVVIVRIVDGRRDLTTLF